MHRNSAKGRRGESGLAACLFAASLSASGCSWIFVQKLPPSYDPRDLPDCTSNRGAPVVDTIFTVTNLASAIYVAGENNATNKGAAVGLGTAVAALWLSSAIYGYKATSECDDAREEFNLSLRRPRLWIKPPTYFAPPPPTTVPPPAVAPSSPAEALPPPVSVPPPAGQGSTPIEPSPATSPPPAPQQEDDDDPSGRPRTTVRPPTKAGPERPNQPRFGN